MKCLNCQADVPYGREHIQVELGRSAFCSAWCFDAYLTRLSAHPKLLTGLERDLQQPTPQESDRI